MPRDIKPDQDCLELCARAGEMLKGAGFELRHASMKTEACYYGWPGYEGLIRVAGHSKPYKRTQHVGDVIARVTFKGTILSEPGRMRISDDKVSQIVAQAIGWYFLRSAHVAQPDRAAAF